MDIYIEKSETSSSNTVQWTRKWFLFFGGNTIQYNAFGKKNWKNIASRCLPDFVCE